MYSLVPNFKAFFGGGEGGVGGSTPQINPRYGILTWSNRLCSVTCDCHILEMAAVMHSKTIAGAIQEPLLCAGALQFVQEDGTDPNSIQEDSIGGYCSCRYNIFAHYCFGMAK